MQIIFVSSTSENKHDTTSQSDQIPSFKLISTAAFSYWPRIILTEQS